MPISVHFPNSRSPALIMITRRTADEESVAMTMNKNKNIVDVILGKMVPRVSMMLFVCIVSHRNAEFCIPHGPTPSDKRSFVCFLCAIHTFHCFESVLWLQMY